MTPIRAPPGWHQALVQLFGLEDSAVRVVSEHVGGGFGSKGSTRPQTVLAAMAARMLDRPVRVTLSRQQLFCFGRIPHADHPAGASGRRPERPAGPPWTTRCSSRPRRCSEFAEQTAVISRVMYAAPNLRTRHRLVALDVPTPRWMRAPGEAPGSFAVESAMDELAEACGVDPIDLRVRNEPAVEPEGGRPFSSRNLVACLREGAARFGWAWAGPQTGRPP